jgi:hypothetical protein
VAADTLEHVPLDRREPFVKECCRVARRWAVLAGPYHHERVQEAEELLQGFLREKLGVEHRYLNEHRSLGLPNRAQVEEWCRAAGAHKVVSIGHGNLDRWLTLLTLELYLDDEPRLRELAKRLYRFYSGAVYASDREGLVYRHAVVASLDGTLPPTPAELFGVGDVRADEVAAALAELAAFDRERDVLAAERERLQGEIDRRDEDLAGHKVRIAELREDLEGHTESLETLEQDLEGHVKKLAETEDDLEQHRELVAAVRGEIAQVREYAAGLEEELNHINAVASDLHEQLLHATRWQRKIRRWKDRLRGLVGLPPRGE